MARYVCINCGTFIMKSGISDPYICRACEKLIEGAEGRERYTHFDNYPW